ncbi:nitrilase-related carbon-nitrogen hydrolase [Kosmotoga sp.]|uniref:nitrilase-related carbon-nitrogen hydrolase n=1 Tax=Kosmotoga sp. TaxID=1955248 RepID=UPI0024AB3B4C|nr:nitrilase-related carbon-nitrogen hydrolase [Kosmotoga sp.]MDI3524216.1 omega-amidase [Kosmotoga sp.]MDK2953273.1 omega-amidase [Kosmotoga sp.]
MKIAVAEIAPFWESKDENKKMVSELFNQARAGEVELMLFPEMTLTGFTMNTSMYDDGKDLEFFKENAEKYGIAVVFGRIVKYKDSFYNAATFYDPFTKTTTDYFKRKLFKYGKEDQYYTPGDRAIRFRYKGIEFSPFVCFDLRFPELFCDAKGADVFIVIASWPEKRKDHWHTLLKARAIENQTFIFGVNRSGRDPITAYDHLSIAFDYYGNTLKAISHESLKIYNITTEMLQVMYRWRESFPYH